MPPILPQRNEPFFPLVQNIILLNNYLFEFSQIRRLYSITRGHQHFRSFFTSVPTSMANNSWPLQPAHK